MPPDENPSRVVVVELVARALLLVHLSTARAAVVGAVALEVQGSHTM